MRKYIFFAALVGFMLFLPQPVHAAILNKNYTRELFLEQEGLRVKETLTTTIGDRQYSVPAGSEEVFLIFNPILNDAKAQEKIDKTLPTIVVTDSKGNKLTFRTEVKDQNILVSVRYPMAVRQGVPQSLIINYTSYALATKAGSVYDIYVPSFAEDFKFIDGNLETKINTSVHVPKTFGDINFASPEIAAQDKGSEWLFNFTHQQLTGVLAWIQVGTKQYYKFEINQPYEGTSAVGLYQNTYELMLPRAVSAGPLTQTPYFTDISPAPSETYLDENGNLIGKFKVPANVSGQISVKGYIEITVDPKFDFTASGSISDIPPAISQSAIGEADFWEVNASEIVAKATELKGTETDVYKLIDKTYRYVVDQIDYSEVKRFGLNERQGALKTLKGGAAVCMEYSDLFIALMRAQGVPARAAFGYGYDSRSTNSVDTAHQWAEVYLPKYNTWVAVDTTWGETGSAVIGGDLNHFYKYVATKSPIDPAPVQIRYLGQLNSVPTENFTITAQEAAQVDKTNAQSQDELLKKYPQRSGTIFDSVIDTVVMMTSFVDTQLTKLYTAINLPTASLAIAKLITYLLLGAIIIGGTVVIVVRNRKLRNKPKSRLAQVKPAA